MKTGSKIKVTMFKPPNLDNRYSTGQFRRWISVTTICNNRKIKLNRLEMLNLHLSQNRGRWSPKMVLKVRKSPINIRNNNNSSRSLLRLRMTPLVMSNLNNSNKRTRTKYLFPNPLRVLQRTLSPFSHTIVWFI